MKLALSLLKSPAVRSYCSYLSVLSINKKKCGLLNRKPALFIWMFAVAEDTILNIIASSSSYTFLLHLHMNLPGGGGQLPLFCYCSANNL